MSDKNLKAKFNESDFSKVSGIVVDKCINKYVREENTNRVIGMIAAVTFSGSNKVCVGWCVLHDLDIFLNTPFNYELAAKIVLGRAKKHFYRGGFENRRLPKKILSEMIPFLVRCRRYFKDKEVPILLAEKEFFFKFANNF